MRFAIRACAGLLLPIAIVAIAVVVVSAQKETQVKPFPAYHFVVEIDGSDVTYPFRSCSGLKIEQEVVEYREGGSNDFTRKLIGQTKYSNIRLSRAFTGDHALYDWFAATKKPEPTKVTGRIIMFDRQGIRVAAWKFVGGFPVKWEGPELDASTNEVPIETIEIAIEGLTFSDENN